MAKLIKHLNQINFSKILEKYRPIEDPFVDDDENRLRKIVYAMSDADRNIVLLYWELGTVRSVAKALKVSDNLVMNKILELKMYIKDIW